MKTRYNIFAIIALICMLFLLFACKPNSTEKKVRLKVIIAGSLLAPFQEVKREYEALNSDVEVLLEGHGSVQVIRAVTELGDRADLMVVADAQLIPAMMYTVPVCDDGPPYADWLIEFSTNRLGLAYHGKSAYSSEINENNWYEIISKPDVSLGISDPRIDAMGYRSLMVLKLAEKFYGDEEIFQNVVGHAFQPPIQVVKDNDLQAITVPELLRPIESRIKLRGYSILLLALLESGDLDYAFEYESVAKQRGLKFLALPEQIDLSSVRYEENYRQVEVKLEFKRFASLLPDFIGTRIVYGLSIPNNATHPDEAAKLISFILGGEGKRIFANTWQPLLEMSTCDYIERLPEFLKSFFLKDGP